MPTSTTSTTSTRTRVPSPNRIRTCTSTSRSRTIIRTCPRSTIAIGTERALTGQPEASAPVAGTAPTLTAPGAGTILPSHETPVPASGPPPHPVGGGGRRRRRARLGCLHPAREDAGAGVLAPRSLGPDGRFEDAGGKDRR